MQNRTTNFINEFRSGELEFEQISDIILAIAECCTETDDYEESLEFSEFVKKLIEAATWLDIYTQS